MFGDYGRRLKAERERVGLSQRALSAAVGASPGYISQIEAGRSGGDPENWVKLARLFGVRLAWLVTGDGSRHGPGVMDALSAEDRDLLDRLVQRLATRPGGSAHAGPASLALVKDSPPGSGELAELPLFSVAALDDGSPSFDGEQEGTYLVTAELAGAGRAVVRVRGCSMDGACFATEVGLPDGALCIVETANLDYSVGDRVIAWTRSNGVVVKRYAGQGSRAKPPLKRGWLRLTSDNPESATIEGRIGVDIQVKAKVVHVLPGPTEGGDR